MKKFKILYVSPFAQDISGVDECLVQLLEHFKRGQVEAVVALPRWSRYVPRYEKAGAQVIFIGPVARLVRTLNPLTWLHYLFLFPINVWSLWRAARKYQVDLIHTNEFVLLQGGLVARLLGLPSVYHVRGDALRDPRPLWVYWSLSRLLMWWADHIFVISQGTAQIFTRNGIPLGDKVQVLYDGIAWESRDRGFHRKTINQRYKVSPRDILVGTVGRLHPRKRMEIFIQAAVRLRVEIPRCRFLIVGGTDGSPAEEKYARALHAEAKRLKLDDVLIFAGPQPDPMPFMEAFDVFLVTSVHEGFGRVLIEAMAATVPIVASRSGAIPEVLGDAGVLVEPEDPAAFAQAALDLIRKPATAQRLRRLGRARVKEKFAMKTTCDSVLRVYKELLT
jgi:glycosyltransferase involved in cell wall biosynthesis